MSSNDYKCSKARKIQVNTISAQDVNNNPV